MSKDLSHVPESVLREKFAGVARQAADRVHGACADLEDQELNEFISAFARLCLDVLETAHHQRGSVHVPERFEMLWSKFWGLIIREVEYERERNAVLALATQQLFEVFVERAMRGLQEIRKPTAA